jgi:3-oxoacyl-[acyl-carrier protein] reductase
MINLEGKVAIVTGGARDIGRSISIKLASLGAKVCVNYFRDADKGGDTLEVIKAAGGQAITVVGDMTKPEDITNLISECRNAFGEEIHILVNVAGGLFGRKTIAEVDDNFWNLVMDTNLKSTFMVTQKTLPFMPSGSAIVNFSSQAARDGGGPGAIIYASAKGAVLTMTRGMAKELGPQGIRVNAISPGMINTTFHDVFTKSEVRERVAAGTPLRREGNADEVADLTAYLASDASSFITGTSTEINGGTYFI